MTEQRSTCQPCLPSSCDTVFDRVVVSHLVRGMTRIMWELLDTFTDPAPLVFQLQVGTTSNPDADDWTDVGLPVENVYFAHDPEQRVWGKTNWTHYRVKLTTSQGTYYSLPTGGMGVLDRRSWRLAREIVRQRLLGYRFGPGGQDGYLLKRRWTGADCPTCLDPMTREVRDPNCPDCYGTGKRCGYYYPMACVWAEVQPKYRRTELDGGQARGTIQDVVLTAEMLGSHLLSEGDIWVSRQTDDRYYVHNVQHTAEMRGVPLVAQVQLRPVPFTSVVYTIQIPDQLARIGLLSTDEEN
jgi:hypothetical protein